MTIFIYKGISQGANVEGTIEAEGKHDAAQQLASQGMEVLKLDEKTNGGSVGRFYQRLMVMLNNVKTQEKIQFAGNLSKMISAGLPMTRALTIMKRQAKNPRFKSVLESIESEVSKGVALSAALAKFPDVFSALFVSMVRAGEESGNLANSLLMVSDQMNRVYTLQKKVRGAMMYPGIILTVMVGIAVLMLMYIVPTLSSTFKELQIDLPASTQFIISVSDVLRLHWMLIGGGLTLLGVLFWQSLKNKHGKAIFDRIIVKLPLIGEIAQQSNTARVTRTLSSLLSSGVEYVHALDIAKEVVQNVQYKDMLDTARTSIEKGGALSDVFAEYEKIVPIFASEMARVGEETGKLSDMLLGVAVYYEDEVERSTKDMSTVIEPVLMVLIGIAVGFFAISMLSPMYSLADKI